MIRLPLVEPEYLLPLAGLGVAVWCIVIAIGVVICQQGRHDGH